ncbi:MAG: alpha/beta fold hydrolase [Bacteroidota bacterium]|nr:alpha/beta fold hydrolase [Bacteroidota bacterium]
MKKFKSIASILVLMIVFTTTLFAQQNKDIVGIWQGKLNINGVELRLIFHISESESGELSATLDSPDQGAKDIPLDKVVYENKKIKITSAAMLATYTGTVDTDSLKITGTWEQSTMELPLNLEKIDEIPKLNRPQEPKPPYQYFEEEVKFINEKDNITLAGTLTYPKEGNNFIAVVLISGSGAQNRDEELFEHKPFKVIADYLTLKGIAVLRFDDRGAGKSGGSFSGSTTEDFANDVEAAVDYLNTMDFIDKNKIGLIGHSEGGVIAPLLASRSDKIDFIVMMAGLGTKGNTLLIDQTKLILEKSGMEEKFVNDIVEINSGLYEIVLQGYDNEKAEKEIREFYKTISKKYSSDEKTNRGLNEQNIDATIKQLLSPWFKYFLAYNPETVLSKVKCPILAINGTNDLQVPADKNLEGIKSAVEKGGNKNLTIKKFEGLNHLFQTSESGLPSEYGKIEETISVGVLEYLGEWIGEL